MKLLSVCIPCYNSAAYMHKAIESCLVFGNEIEIIVVDDGSQKDNTYEIGKRYQQEYPDIVKCIHQENGGHGQAVNTGIENATGVYFKVLDSDDWFDEVALLKVRETLRGFVEQPLDMLVCNYVYEKPSENKTRVINYKSVMPQDKVFSWKDTKKFAYHQNLIMHSVIYKRQLLIDCNIKLPKHTFYVDNIFVYQPLPYVEKMYYMNVDLYRYFIGRDDQSVNEKIMIERLDQQIKVNKIMIDCCDVMALSDEKCKKYMIKYLTMITTVSNVLMIKSGTTENMAKRQELWDYLKNHNRKLYVAINGSLLGKFIQADTFMFKRCIITGYYVCRNIFGFN